LAAVSILALGAGLPLAILHLVNGIGRYMYDVPDATAIVRVSERSQFPTGIASFYRQHNSVFSFLIAENRGWRVSINDDALPVQAAFVSADYFQSLKLVAAHGRLFDARDSEPDAAPAVILGHAYWQRAFGGDPDVVDQTVRLNGRAVRVAGVAPATFDGLAQPGTLRAAVWLPLAQRPQLIEGSPPLDDVLRSDSELYGRLKPGISIDAAGSQIDALTRELQRQHGGQAAVDRAIRVVPLMKGPRFEADVAVLVVLFFLIFFSACANLGNMLLARALGRGREIETRMLLGATRVRLVRQLLTENLVLAVLGCTVATGVGYLGARMLLRFTDDMPPGMHVQIDARMIAASFAVVFLAVFGFGLTPALQAVRRRRTSARARQTLVAVQVAASCVLLVLATLLTRASDRVRGADLALDYGRTIVLDMQLGPRTLTPVAQRAVLADAAARLEQLPVVDSVSLGVPRRFVAGRPGLLFQEVSPPYFATLRIPLLRGRLFTEREQGALIVSESAARAAWPGQDPIGQTWIGADRRRLVVVGVVKDTGLAARGDEAGEAYIPLLENNLSRAVLYAHTNGDAAGLLRDARAATASARVFPLALPMAATMALEPRSPGSWIAALGFLATLLAFTGIFTLVGFSVIQRTHEIGVRMALGASRADVLTTLLTQYARPIVAGAAVGVALAAGAAQVLRNQLYGLTPFDLLSHASALAAFAVVAVLAILLPARRALRINPAAALRAE
jgi:predicted permease